MAKEEEDRFRLTAEEKLRMGKSLKELREEKKLSQDDLAALLKCTPQYISDVERGKYALSIKKLMILCEEFDVSCDSLLYGKVSEYSEYDVRRQIMSLLDGLTVDQILAIKDFLKLAVRVSA